MHSEILDDNDLELLTSENNKLILQIEEFVTVLELRVPDLES